MLRRRVVWIEKIQRANQRVPIRIRNAPRVAAFADHDAPRAQLQRGLAHPRCHFLHRVLRAGMAADEQTEVRRFRCMRTQSPTDPGAVKNFCVTDETVHMRLGEKIRGRSDQQHFRAVIVQRKLNRGAAVIKNFFLQLAQSMRKRRLLQAEIVADLVNLADDFVGIFLPQANARENFAAGHRDFGGVDSKRAVHRAAPAFRTLVVVGVPFAQHFLGEIGRADQPWKIFSGEGEVTAVHFSQ